MKHIVQFAVFILLFTINTVLYGQQHHVIIGSDIPLQYAVGYEYKPVRWLGIQTKAGLLLAPYDQAILGIMELLGVEQGIIKMINESFNFGSIAQLGVNFHAKKWYYTIHAQFISLNASDVPSNLIENYYGYNLRPIDFANSMSLSRRGVEITMKSNLLQAGVGFGRKIALNKWAELRLELMAGKNVWSNTNINVNNVKGTVYGLLFDEEDLKNELENDLEETFKKHAYTPSVNAYLTFKF